MKKQDYEQLTLFPEGSRVSRSVQPGSEEARQMTAISGRKCLELLKKSGPLGSLARMLLGSSAWANPCRLFEWRAEALTAYRTRTIMKRYSHDAKTCSSSRSSKILDISDTKSSHLLYRLVPLVPRTGETDSQSLPTVTRFDATCGDLKGKEYTGTWHSMKLIQAVSSWPTPTASDCGRTAINPILTKNGTIRHKGKTGQQSYARLDAVAALLPTPIATDWKNRGCKDYRKNRQFQLQTTVGGQLNPTWVEWLMGFPIGWTDLKDWGTLSARRSSARFFGQSRKLNYS